MTLNVAILFLLVWWSTPALAQDIWPSWLRSPDWNHALCADRLGLGEWNKIQNTDPIEERKMGLIRREWNDFQKLLDTHLNGQADADEVVERWGAMIDSVIDEIDVLERRQVRAMIDLWVRDVIMEMGYLPGLSNADQASSVDDLLVTQSTGLPLDLVSGTIIHYTRGFVELLQLGHWHSGNLSEMRPYARMVGRDLAAFVVFSHFQDRMLLDESEDFNRF